MKEYIGITIGPIYDMMSLVSTPAALWATSYMFSTIAKKTCEKLSEKGIKIISPFYDTPDNALFKKEDGIGLFHDRIFIEKNENATLKVIDDIKTSVLEDVSRAFGLKEDELTKRILFVAAEIELEECEGKNPILKGGKILDSLELSKKVMFIEESNPILANFTGISTEEEEKEENETDQSKKTRKNQIIKDVAKNNLGIKADKWPMVFEKKNEKGEKIQLIKSLPVIAKAVRNSDMKKHNYYAIVRSDGDNMSKIIERLEIETERKDENGQPLNLAAFSERCLQYCSEVADLVKKYKGVPVYSSGDDLLAIMPCDSGEVGTIFNFIDEVNKKFKDEKLFGPFIKMIKDENEKNADDKKIKVPSLSFGITICFNRFPLYEALDDSAHLLFDIAKKTQNKKTQNKNCSVVRLQKHSGQSEGLLISNDFLPDFLKIHNTVLNKEKQDSMNELLLSALYKTEKFEKLFSQTKNDAQVKNLFENTFDAPNHENNQFVHQDLPDFYNDICRSNGGIIALSDDGLEDENEHIKVFNFALRMLKFFVEKSGKEGKNNGNKKI